MELPSVIVHRPHTSKEMLAFSKLQRNALLVAACLLTVMLLSSYGPQQQSRGTVLVVSSKQQRLLNAATRNAAVELMSENGNMRSAQFQKLLGDSSISDEDEDSEMPIHWHKKPYGPRNRASVDQEGNWKVRWSREDDPETAGRMDDARWNLLSKLGMSEHSSRHDDIPAVPYYERIAELEKDAYNEERQDIIDAAGSKGSGEPVQAVE
jgi:hypothetical protein